jgi:protein transport protein SEC24
MTGRRIDFATRPELRFGSIEYVAPKDYMTRAPLPASYVFALDVSQTAVTNGSLAVACNSLKRALALLPRENPNIPSPCKVAIMTFDRTVQFYNLKVRSAGFVCWFRPVLT